MKKRINKIESIVIISSIFLICSWIYIYTYSYNYKMYNSRLMLFNTLNEIAILLVFIIPVILILVLVLILLQLINFKSKLNRCIIMITVIVILIFNTLIFTYNRNEFTYDGYYYVLEKSNINQNYYIYLNATLHNTNIRIKCSREVFNEINVNNTYWMEYRSNNYFSSNIPSLISYTNIKD